MNAKLNWVTLQGQLDKFCVLFVMYWAAIVGSV